MYSYLFIYAYRHTSVHACIHTYVHTSIHPYLHTSIHPYIRTYMLCCINREYIYMYIYTCIWARKCCMGSTSSMLRRSSSNIDSHDILEFEVSVNSGE